MSEKITQDDAAAILGISRSPIGRHIAIRDSATPETKQAYLEGKITHYRAAKIARLPRERQADELKKWIDKATTPRQKSIAILTPELPLPPVGTEQQQLQDEFEKFNAEKLAFINAPSLYPTDAELPTHITEFGTRHIREAIVELQKEEAHIACMTRGELFRRIHPYTQRIQTYGTFGTDQHIHGPLDKRWETWAANCFHKLRAREAMLLKREDLRGQLRPTVKRSKRSKSIESVDVRGNEFERLFRPFKQSLRERLKPFPFQYESQLLAEIQKIVAEHFAEKREAYAKRSRLHKDGAQSP